MSELALDVQQLTKTYRDGWIFRKRFAALKGISFQVSQGEIFGLLGPNGAGKTTFIKILLGIIGKSSGRATMLSYPAGSRGGRQQVGYLPEQLRIPRHLTGYTALEFYGSLSNVAVSEVRRRRDELLGLVGLHGRGQDSVTKYSKGMLQRLGLAQALLHRPKLLVLDEPTDGLDPKARAEMRALLHRLRAKGVTIFLNSHILQEVELVCDRVAILDKGEMLYCGGVSEIGQFVQQQSGQTQLTVRWEMSGELETIRSVLAASVPSQQDVLELRQEESTVRARVRFDSQSGIDRVVDGLRGRGISVVGLEREHATLEDAFLKILGNSEKENGSS